MYVVNISSFISNILLNSTALTNFLSLAYRPSSNLTCNVLGLQPCPSWLLTYLIEILLDLPLFQQNNLDRNCMSLWGNVNV